MSYTNYGRAPGDGPQRPVVPHPQAPGPLPPLPHLARAAVARAQSGRHRPGLPPGVPFRITEARWSTTTAKMGDEVHLECALEGTPPARLRFAVLECDDRGRHRSVLSLDGSPEGASCKVAWTIDERAIPPLVEEDEEDDTDGATSFFFVVTGGGQRAESGAARDKMLRVTDLPVRLRMLLHLDPTDPRTYDDKVILTAEDGYEQTRTLARDGRRRGHRTQLVFDGLKAGAKLSCRIDPGADGPPYFAFRDRTLGARGLE